MTTSKPLHRKGTVVFVMPRHRHDDVRVVHKEAWAVSRRGYDVVLLCREAPCAEYLGMRVVDAAARGRGFLRPFSNTPRLFRRILELPADIYVLENPDTLALALLLIGAGKRVVYSTHEDFLAKVRIRRRVPRLLRVPLGMAIVAAEYLVAHLARGMLVTQPSVARRYSPHARLVRNAPLVDGPVMQRSRLLQQRLPAGTSPTMIYAGGISRRRGLERMLELVLRLNEFRRWRLQLVGAFAEAEDLELARRHPGWRHVEHAGRVEHALALAHIRCADIGLALLDDVGGFSETSITKLYEYMLLETPFVASDFRTWRESIEDVPAGLFVGHRDTARLARSIDAMFSDRRRYQRMQITGRRYIERKFNWTTEGAAVEAAIDEALPQALGDTQPYA